MDQEKDSLHSEDLQWARQLAAGDRSALVRYEQELLPMISGQLRRRGFTDDAIAEVHQAIRVRLFVGDGEGPAIARYEGRAALKSWVMISALREATRTRDKARREPAVEDDALIALADRADVATDDPAKERYRETFKVAFRAALATLPPRDRVLLRFAVIDQLTVDQIGAIQGVHRATAARWIDRARAQLAAQIKREFMARLGADPFETQEVLTWMQSRITLSLSAI
ncbi:MAG TPA: sigma-70 family RNA polymerase sigma factor [Kofleriaceae bacterium]